MAEPSRSPSRTSPTPAPPPAPSPPPNDAQQLATVAIHHRLPLNPPNLDPLIIQAALKDFKDKIFVTKVENDFLALLSEAKRDGLVYSMLSSFHRLLIHRIADYYGLSHRYERSRDTLLVTRKGDSAIRPLRIIDIIVSTSALPPAVAMEPLPQPDGQSSTVSAENGDNREEEKSSAASVPADEEIERDNEPDDVKAGEKIKVVGNNGEQSNTVALAAQVRIMRREGNNRSPSVDKDDPSNTSTEAGAPISGTNGAPVSRQGSQAKTIEERERAYLEARARIFQESSTGIEGNDNGGSNMPSSTSFATAGDSNSSITSHSYQQANNGRGRHGYGPNSGAPGGVYAPRPQQVGPWSTPEMGYVLPGVRPFSRPPTFGYGPMYQGFVPADMETQGLMYAQPYPFTSPPPAFFDPSEGAGSPRDFGKGGQSNSPSPGVGGGGGGSRRGKMRHFEGDSNQQNMQSYPLSDQRGGPGPRQFPSKRYTGGSGGGGNRNWIHGDSSRSRGSPAPRNDSANSGPLGHTADVMTNQSPHPGFSYHGLHPPQPYFRFAGPPTTYYYPTAATDDSMPPPPFAFPTFPVMGDQGQQFPLQPGTLPANYQQFLPQYFEQPGAMGVRFDGTSAGPMTLYGPPGVVVRQREVMGVHQDHTNGSIPPAAMGQNGHAMPQNDLATEMSGLRIG
ncbi:hypothetical protein M427DRAFT_32575 [Gonapodya prolifera JEL478]|uniref:SUZ domain-containing protein n=1 Tax=Gonapodya prolifera (strain JEL478) TaxID=1344416 RepID=A0A139AE44_GONPJ|nr:hypothetical protein M427DRAFT_32575 [Gonapodya prolifera JEL478]|eukprot:KXS15096.1 hypothetical protein M427DRAFT_32575 [Gonapodya prolifera JEL478]